MLTEANLLVLDEPTNDLDLATLHVLEEALDEFAGGLILVTHDRLFLDRLSHQILAFDRGDHEFFADVYQWEEWFKKRTLEADKSGKGAANLPAAQNSIPAPKKTKKLSYKDQRDLDTMEERVAKAEAQVAELTGELAKSAGKPSGLKEIGLKLAAAQKEVDALYARWEELLALQSTEN
jgi:ATP-binding cassette subfamily F protein uup